MIYPDPSQRSTATMQRPVVALSWYPQRVNASVFVPDCHAGARLAQYRSTAVVPVVDGQVVTSTVTVPARRPNDDNQILAQQPKRSLLGRAIDDPYWILMTLAIALGASITTTVIYGIIQITLAIGRWFTTNGTTLATIAALVVVLALCGGATAAKCAGIHCGGCKG